MTTVSALHQFTASCLPSMVGLQMVHKNPQRFHSFEQTASRFLLASITVRARGYESMAMWLQSFALVLEVYLVSE